jgi:hypothetical protein
MLLHVSVAFNPDGCEINAQAVFCDPLFALSFFTDISPLRKPTLIQAKVENE